MSIELNDYIEDSITKAFVTVNNKIQPKLTELQGRYSTNGYFMLGRGDAYTMSNYTDPNELLLRRQAAFAYAFNRMEYMGHRYNKLSSDDPIESDSVTFNTTIIMDDNRLTGESYDLQIIDRSSYSSSTDTVTTRLSFIANQTNGMRTYRGTYNGTKVGSADATGTCTLDELLPATFTTTTDRIRFKGTGSTGVTYDMIRFIDNTNDDYGYGIAIGGGGPVIIGGGESAATVLADTTNWPTSGGQEITVIGADGTITFLSNLQNGTSSSRKFTMDSNGSMYINSGGLFVGANKRNTYSESGAVIHPDGYICLSNSTSVGSRGGVYFAYNNQSSATSYIREYSSGYLQIHNNLMVDNAVLVGSTPKTDYYTQSGVGLAPNGNITLTGTTTTGVGAGLYFAYNGSSSYSQWMRAAYNSTYGGYLEVSPSLIANYHVRAIGAGEHFCEAWNTTTGIRCLLDVNGSYIQGLWSNGYNTGGTNHDTWTTTNFASSTMWMIYRGYDGKVNINNLATGVNVYGHLQCSSTLQATGNIQAKASGVHCYAESSTTGCYVSCYSASDGTHGIYSNGFWSGSNGPFTSQGKWLIRRGTDNNVMVKANYDATTMGMPIITNSTYNNVMGLIDCSGNAQVRFYGRWASTSLGYRYVTVTTSDPRLKENIKECNTDALDIINKIKLYSFDWKADNNHWDIGYIAPELEDIDHNLVIIPKQDDDKDGYYSVNDFYLSGVQTKAIQELSAENDKLKEEISQLKETLSNINEKLKKLEV